MSDISSQIGSILSNPEMMEQIKSLSGLLGQSAGESKEQPAPISPPPSPAAPEMLPAVMKLMPLLTTLQDDDDTTRLLRAIKPFLSPERQERIEQAIKIVRIIRLVPLIKENGGFGLF